MPKITIIQPTKPDDSGKIRVAAYCRVSTNTADQHNSYTVQTEYYTHRFAVSDTEILVGIYADEGISGTGSAKREDFQRMLRDCRKGKIDRIYTKSVSRFARNTKECLQYIRELKLLGVTVWFEKENIDTGRMSDEMMLTILGGLAQEESVSMSNNLKWGIRKKMQQGTYKIPRVPYGYIRVDDEIYIQEEQASVVKQIFDLALSGCGAAAIADELTSQGIPTVHSKEIWHSRTILDILKNEWYIGDTLYQKTCATSTLPHRQVRNRGQEDQYYIENTHPAIITRQAFERVQEMRQERLVAKPGKQYPLSLKIYCDRCGASYKREQHGKQVSWVCRNHRIRSQSCPGAWIPEESFYAAFIILHNKLCIYYTDILIPLQNELLHLKSRMCANSAAITHLRNEIFSLREQGHVLASLRTKGFLSDSKFQEQTTELQSRIGRRKRELSLLLHSEDEDESLDHIGKLIEYFEKRQDGMTGFEQDVFTTLIDRIMVKDKHELEFYLPGGFHFTERI